MFDKTACIACVQRFTSIGIIPTNRQRYYNVIIWLYEGLVEPNVAKTLLQCFVQVMKTFSWNQPKINVVKTLYC